MMSIHSLKVFILIALLALPIASHARENSKCQIIGKYVVITTEDKEAAGEDIALYLFDPTKPKTDCVKAKSEKPAFFLKNKMGNWFSHLYRDLLIIDEGTSRARTLRIFDILQKKEIRTIDAWNFKYKKDNLLSYFDVQANLSSPCAFKLHQAWAKLKKEKSPLFDKTPEPKCPTACDEWLRGGNGVILEAEVNLDLKTLHEKFTGKAQCSITE